MTMLMQILGMGE